VLIKSHDALRARLVKDELGNYYQRIFPFRRSSLAYEVRQFSSLEACGDILQSTQTTLDLYKGPTLAAVIFLSDQKPHYLGLVLPRVFVDGPSWRIITSELSVAWDKASDSEALPNNGLHDPLAERVINGHIDGHFPRPTVGSLGRKPERPRTAQATTSLDGPINGVDKQNSFFAWTNTQFTNETGEASASSARTNINHAHTNRVGIVSNKLGRTISLRLSSNTVRTLFESATHLPFRTEPSDLLVAALMLAVKAVDGHPSASMDFIDIENGRLSNGESAHLSTTMGCFDVLCEYNLRIDSDETHNSLIRKVKDLRRGFSPSQTTDTPGSIEAVKAGPQNGWCFLVDHTCQWLLKRPETSSLHPLVSLASSASLVSLSPNRSSIYVSMSEQGMSFTIPSSESSEAARLNNLIKAFEGSLSKILDQLSIQAPSATLSDFPYLSLNYFELENLVKKLRHVVKDPLADIDGVFPCCESQKAMLIAQAKDPTLYQCSFVVKLTSTARPIDVTLMQLSWERIIERHAFLRSLFIESQWNIGSFEQVVLRHASSRFDFLSREQAAASGFVNLQPFVFDSYEIPHRMTVVQESDHQIFCRLDCSHAIFDGTSIEILMKELCADYHGQRNSDPVLSYQDFQSFQTNTNPNDYWLEYLGNVQMSQFPVSNPDADARSLRTVRICVDTSLNALRQFSDNHAITFAQICQLGWGLVLQRFTGVRDVCYPYVTSGRDVDVTGIEEAVGCFVNLLPCRLDFDDSCTVQNLLEKLKLDNLQSLPHQHHHVPIAQRQISDRKYGNTIMSFLQRSTDEEINRDMAYEYVQRYTPTDFDIVIYIQVHGQQFDVEIDFWSSRVDDMLAKRIGQTFAKAITSILEQPDCDIKNLVLLSDLDRCYLERWNGQQPESQPGLLHELVHAQVLQEPDALAIASWDGSLTYRALDEMAERLASFLITLGVKPETKIALSFEKSLWAVVSQLAVLKSGGAVVSLGTSSPLSALREIIKDSAASIILVGGDAQASRLKGLTPHVITVDSTLLAGLLDRSFQSPVQPSSAAWVIYTSGSTGKPKGVILEHTTLCTTIKTHGPAYGITNDSRVFQFSAYTFDVSIYDTFTTLSFGGCVCVPSEQDRLDNLVDSMKRLRINVASLTSTVASLLHPSDLPLLKTLILLGEPARPTVVEEWAPHSTVLNAYGPAEGCITTVGRLITKENASRIGHPLACRVWVTNPNAHEVLNPIGVPGELLIEGPLVARGYLNDSLKTQQSFIIDPPFVQQYGFSLGRRMYCTGDLVSQDLDGALRHLGRIDAQIKINGQRVEPGEIEYWAKTLGDAVQRASVNMIHPRGDIKRTMLTLALDFTNESPFYRPIQGVLALSDDLQSFLIRIRSSLLEKVPSYMVPSLFVPMGMIPQTTSAKVDRLALRAILEELDSTQLVSYSLTNIVKPTASTQTELLLQELWATVLGAPRHEIGVKDNFFLDGGDSLVAMQLVGHCRKANISLTVADIFKHPRLDQMAALLEKRDLDGAQAHEELDDGPFSLWADVSDLRLSEIANLCGVSLEEIEDVYPCTPLQEGLFALTAYKPHAYIYRQVFRLDSIDLDRFQKAWQTVAQIMPILRTVIVPDEGPRSLQIVLRKELEWVTGTSVAAYIESDKQAHIQMGLPLTRYAIIKSENHAYFVWTAHHSAYDGVTLRKLFGLLAQVYMRQPLPQIVPFKRFVKHLEVTESEHAQTFWSSQLLEHATPFPHLPYRTHQIQVAGRSWHNITVPSISFPVTLSNLLRAAWAIVVASHTHMDTVLFGVTLSGRTAPLADIGDILGPTIATVPIQIHLDRRVLVSEYLTAVQQQATDMIPFDHTGLQNIRRLVSPSALPDLGHLFVVQFPQEEEKLLTGIMPGLDPHFIASQEFDTYALNVFCTLTLEKAVSVKVETRFDEKVISEPEVNMLIEQLEHVLHQLGKSLRSTVADIGLMPPVAHAQMNGSSIDKAWGNEIPNHDRIGSTGALAEIKSEKRLRGAIPNADDRDYRETSATPVSQQDIELQAICAEVLGLSIEETPLRSSFGTLGGDSILAMQLVMRCRKKGFSISVRDVVRSKSIADIASAVRGALNETATKAIPLNIEESVNWYAEAALESTPRPEPCSYSTEKKSEIVLTGSTGFLGHHILEELVASPAVSRIHCIAVRAQGRGNARTKPIISEKVVTYTGDLTVPHLGLTDEQCSLFGTCKAIIHCGAQVSFIQPYHGLRKPNVDSTKQLAQFALQYRIPFHFISTLGVTHLANTDTFGEASVASYPPTRTVDGYEASKWVSEVFLENFHREFGLPIYIHRPSSIVGPDAPSLDIANNLLRFSRKMHVVPKLEEWNVRGYLDFVDIGAAAANIASTVLQGSSNPRPQGVVYLHESGQLVLPISDLKNYLERDGLAKFEEAGMREWVRLALANGLNGSIAEYLESSMDGPAEARLMPLCETVRDYTSHPDL
jgi:amino acid adenylation domain-containing protein